MLHVARLKDGLASTHPIRGPELRALREPAAAVSGLAVSVCQRAGGPMTPATVRKPITRAGEKGAPLPYSPAHAAALDRLQLANDGHDTDRFSSTSAIATSRTPFGTPN